MVSIVKKKGTLLHAGGFAGNGIYDLFNIQRATSSHYMTAHAFCTITFHFVPLRAFNKNCSWYPVLLWNNKYEEEK